MYENLERLDEAHETHAHETLPLWAVWVPVILWRLARVNVYMHVTHATTGATALLLPAQ